MMFYNNQLKLALAGALFISTLAPQSAQAYPAGNGGNCTAISTNCTGTCPLPYHQIVMIQWSCTNYCYTTNKCGC